jgi:phytoene dehydrogenase-like protein
VKRSYDIAVIGTDLKGLIFAALCAKKGYTVVIIGDGNENNTVQKGDFLFVRKPNLFLGFEFSSSIREIFNELALAPEMRTIPQPFKPSCHVVLPEKRIEISTDTEIFDSELVREFPDQIAKIEELFDLLPIVDEQVETSFREFIPIPPHSIMEYYRYFKSTRPLKPFLSEDYRWDPCANFPAKDPFRAFVSAPLRWTSKLFMQNIQPIPFIRLFNQFLRGFYFLEDGIDGLKDLFVRKIKSSSGDFRPHDEVNALKASGSRIEMLELKGREESIGFSILACSNDIKRFHFLLPDGRREKKFFEHFARINPSHYLFTVNIGINRELLPEGMSQNVILVQDTAKELEDDNCILLQTDPAMSPSKITNTSLATLAAFSLLKNKPKAFTAAELQEARDRILQRLSELIPFFREHTREIWVPSLEKKSTPISDSKDEGSPEPDKTGGSEEFTVKQEELYPVFGKIVKRTLGSSSFTMKTPYKNVFYLGDHFLNGFGFEGDFLGGILAFRTIQKILPLRKVVK